MFVRRGIALDGSLEAALKLAEPTGPGFLMLTFSNAALKEHLYNFVAHAKEVAAPHVVLGRSLALVPAQGGRRTAP